MPPSWVLLYASIYATPWLVALLRRRPRLMCAAATALAAIPFALPVEHTAFRLMACIGLWVQASKSYIAAAGHERPPSYADFVSFLIVPAVTRWDRPRRPDLSRAAGGAALGLAQLAATATLMLAAAPLGSPLAVVPLKQIEMYLCIAGLANLLVATHRLRGLDCDDCFNAPLFAVSPADFWGRRWNTWVNATLFRYAFLPAGGRRHPARGTLAAFFVSGIFHEALLVGASLTFTGTMIAYFMLQGVAVVATYRWRPFRRLAARVPAAAWVATLVFMAASGAIFVHGFDTAWDFHAEAAKLLDGARGVAER